MVIKLNQFYILLFILEAILIKCFYIYKEFGQSSNENQNRPDYIKEIEDYGCERGIKVIWKVRSELERMLQEPKNILLYYIFFKGDFNGIQTLESCIKKSENKIKYINYLRKMSHKQNKIFIIFNNHFSYS